MTFQLLKKIQFHQKQSLREVMGCFEETAQYTNGRGFGVVINERQECIGVVTDGDIRRCLLKGELIDAPIEKAMNREFAFARPGYTPHQILRIFDNRIKNIPVIDEQGYLVDMLLFDDFKASYREEKIVIRSRAPVRVSFAGGGTDMSFYFNGRTGFILSSTINKYCYASVRVRSDSKIKLISKDYQLEEEFDLSWKLRKSDSLALIKACVKLMEPNFGFDLETYSEIKPGTGLGGSSAISAAVVGALNHFRNENHLDNYYLADLAYQAERVELEIAGGWQDQYACVFGGMNLIEFRKNEIIVIPLRIQDEILLELHFNLLLFRFGETRVSGTIANDQRNRLNSNCSLEAQYDQLAKLTLKMKDFLLQGKLKQFGRVLHEGWELKKSFSNKISNSYIDKLYNSAKHAGALGGKVLGAGQSGYLLIYCEPSHQPSIIEAMQSLGARHEYFDFVDSGLQTWTAKC